MPFVLVSNRQSHSLEALSGGGAALVFNPFHKRVREEVTSKGKAFVRSGGLRGTVESCKSKRAVQLQASSHCKPSASLSLSVSGEL